MEGEWVAPGRSGDLQESSWRALVPHSRASEEKAPPPPYLIGQADGSIRFRRLPLSEVDWAACDRYWDRTVFQTRPWLQFLEMTQAGESVVASIESGRRHLGYFTGSIVRRMGCRILGSPFKGWMTDYMGFNLDKDCDRAEVAGSFPAFAFRILNCHYLEIVDRHLTDDAVVKAGYQCRPFGTFEIDIGGSEKHLFATLKQECRTAIRKAAKSGVTIERAEDPGFADDYYAQLQDVFART